MTPSIFAALMQRELAANIHKGDFDTWQPDEKQALGELGYHVAKLCYSIGTKDTAKLMEYSADVGNIAMKIAETFGEPFTLAVEPARGKRVCSDCRRTIGRSERWCFGPDSRARHRGACPTPAPGEAQPAALAPEPPPMLQFTPEEGI